MGNTRFVSVRFIKQSSPQQYCSPSLGSTDVYKRQVFVLTEEENQIYRCKYCEEKYRRRR